MGTQIESIQTNWETYLKKRKILHESTLPLGKMKKSYLIKLGYFII